MTEMGHDTFVNRFALADTHLQIIDSILAIPACLEGARTKDFPSGRIGDRQGQAAVCKPLVSGIHPGAIRPSRHELHRVFFRGVTGHLHGIMPGLADGPPWAVATLHLTGRTDWQVLNDIASLHVN